MSQHTARQHCRRAPRRTPAHALHVGMDSVANKTSGREGYCFTVRAVTVSRLEHLPEQYLYTPWLPRTHFETRAAVAEQCLDSPPYLSHFYHCALQHALSFLHTHHYRALPHAFSAITADLLGRAPPNVAHHPHAHYCAPRAPWHRALPAVCLPPPAYTCPRLLTYPARCISPLPSHYACCHRLEKHTALRDTTAHFSRTQHRRRTVVRTHALRTAHAPAPLHTRTFYTRTPALHAHYTTTRTPFALRYGLPRLLPFGTSTYRTPPYTPYPAPHTGTPPPLPRLHTLPHTPRAPYRTYLPGKHTAHFATTRYLRAAARYTYTARTPFTHAPHRAHHCHAPTWTYARTYALCWKGRFIARRWR